MFQMPSFLSGMGLVGEVALAAERANHHPNILIQYRIVSFSLSTHEVGGITQRDLDLAGTIDELVQSIKSGRRAKKKAKPKKKAARKKPAKKAKTRKKPVGKKKKAAKKKAKKATRRRR